MWERLYLDGIAELHRAILHACLPRPGGTLLDLGCSGGDLTVEIAERVGAGHVYGVELDAARAELARGRGVEVVSGDLCDPWPYEDRSFDVVHSNQVIEHVACTDHFMRETRRVLAPGGYALICTNNLASWHNLVSLALGRQPQPCHVSDEMLLGTLVADGLATPEHHSHLRLFTARALNALATRAGLRIDLSRGVAYYPLPPRLAQVAARVDRRHAVYLLMRFT